jgi:pimeloyl-ACP methyl ester carboxylesterase
MQTQFLMINGLRIAYQDTRGQGPAVIFVHGNSLSKAAFEKQLSSPLARSYRLVALDLPGHGESQHDTNTPLLTYRLPGYATIVVAFAQQLNLTNAVYVGWSLGGNILLEALQGINGHPPLPSPAGVFIFGAPPIGTNVDIPQAFLPNPVFQSVTQEVLSAAEIDAFVHACFKPGFPDARIPRQFYADIAGSDGHARSSLGASIGQNDFANEVQAVSSTTTPLAILHGAEEQLVNGNYYASLITSMPTLWENKVHIVSDAGHAVQEEQSGPFNHLLQAFIDGLHLA